AGGPASHPNYQKHFDTIYASRDPVAIDSIALKKIEEWRRLASLGSLEEQAAHVKVASEMRLGNADHVDLRNVMP
ncbi:MAG: hypothetical protein M3R59_09945, partial [Verrucomicrobiota bacterium]|nr:hypothetical protein [Verrucomicrobiota bacterium]